MAPPAETSHESGLGRFSLSVLVPVYNERGLVAPSLSRLKLIEESRWLNRIQVIVVDDGSTDGTDEALANFRSRLDAAPASVPPSRVEWLFLRHQRNAGKGRAIRTALERAACDVAIIHDADLEYHPRDILSIVEVFATQDADAVFGSRFVGGGTHRVLMFRHQLGNKLLTFLCDLISNLNLTDVWVCYKAVKTELLRSIPLISDDFRIEPEIAIKLAKREARVFEVPISYFGRTYREGKKIGWRDAVAALWAMMCFGLSRDLHREAPHSRGLLARLLGIRRYDV